MSHRPARRRKHRESRSKEHGSQVAVRDGNRLICPCCGEVLMVLAGEPPKEPEVKTEPEPEAPSMPTLFAIIERQEAQRNTPPKESPQQPPAEEERVPNEPHYTADPIVVPLDPEVTAYEFPEEDPPELPKPQRNTKPRERSTKPTSRPLTETEKERRRNRRNSRRRRLRDPETYETKRFCAWIYYRMKKLNIQVIGEIWEKQAEIDRLRLELFGPEGEQPPEPQRKPKPKPKPIRAEVLYVYLHSEVKVVVSQQRRERVRLAIAKRAHEDNGLASSESHREISEREAKERGPP